MVFVGFPGLAGTRVRGRTLPPRLTPVLGFCRRGGRGFYPLLYTRGFLRGSYKPLLQALADIQEGHNGTHRRREGAGGMGPSCRTVTEREKEMEKCSCVKKRINFVCESSLVRKYVGCFWCTQTSC